MQIDNGCGPTAKVVWDAAAIADPDIDYSDYDTDKDGVVDFFMAVFAGCGGNGASQLSAPGVPCSTNTQDALPYDNIWPHSSDLRYYYSDPTTGLPGYTTHDQLKDLEGRKLFYTTEARKEMTTTVTQWPVYVRIGPYNLNPETAIDKASVISHEYGHSLGLPDFYSIDPDGRETYGDWNLMATDKSQNMDAFSRQELGWVVPEVLNGDRTVQGWTDSKHDTGTITWQRPDGTPYTLTNGVNGIVHNSQMYVAKLPGRSLLDPAKFDTGDKASATHAWFSGAGNDFGCATDGKGHNLDVNIPGIKDLPAGSTVKLEFKSMFEAEWDYDYGYVLTSKDAGENWASHPSTRSVPTTTASSSNPNQNTCEAALGNGITGSSASYTDASTVLLDRTLGNYPDMSFVADSFDISDLVGAASPVLRFSYATDPGVAKQGWFIDDLKVTATTPSGDKVLLDTDLEIEGGPTDPRFFSGGCKGGLAISTPCTAGWQFVNAGAAAPFDHAYYLELRDRSGFDIDGNGEIDRDPIGWSPGVYAAYTDEAHGYGNMGVTGIPAQSPLDADPTPGDITPDLDNAAFVPGSGTAPNGPNAFSDAAASAHVDNYVDDAGANWTLSFDCLGFKVDALHEGTNPTPTDANPVSTLTGDATFTLGSKCGAFDYGYLPTVPPVNTAPVAVPTANPTTASVNQVVTFSGAGSHDAETPTSGLDYAWDFDNDGSKDASGVSVTHSFGATGSYPVKLTVSDGDGGTDTKAVTVTVSATGSTAPTAKLTVSKTSPLVSQKVRLSAAGSSDKETPAAQLTYRWNFGDGGSTVDATGATVVTGFTTAGPRVITLTVLDPQGKKSTASKRIVVRREVVCISDSVIRTGSWQRVDVASAPGGNYCDNLGRKTGKDTLTLRFSGPQVDGFYGRSVRGGAADVFIDGRKVGTVSFRGSTEAVRVKFHQVFKGLGGGQHTVKLVVTRGQAYVDGFVITR
jgi:immune inhibitor A